MKTVPLRRSGQPLPIHQHLIEGETQGGDQDISVLIGVHLLHLQAKDHLKALPGFKDYQREVVLVIFKDTIQHFCLCDRLLGDILAEQESHQLIHLHRSVSWSEDLVINHTCEFNYMLSPVYPPNKSSNLGVILGTPTLSFSDFLLFISHPLLLPP